MSLQSIPIHIEATEPFSIGNVRALMTEISACLEQLFVSGQTGFIDLNSLPFAPGEYEQLRQALGKGEVVVHIEATGPSEIFETAYPGVWWLTHRSEEGDIVADLIEITWIPEIIKSQQVDMQAGLARLKAQLNE